MITNPYGTTTKNLIDALEGALAAAPAPERQRLAAAIEAYVERFPNGDIARRRATPLMNMLVDAIIDGTEARPMFEGTWEPVR